MKPLNAQEIFEKLKGKFGAAVVELKAEGFNPPLRGRLPGSIREICRFLKEDPELRFDSLMLVSGVDYKDKFAVAYHLYSMELRHKIGIKVMLSTTTPPSPRWTRSGKPPSSWSGRRTTWLGSCSRARATPNASFSRMTG